MAGTAEVLQEYLVKLGYQTDAISLRKFEDRLGATSKSVLKVGGAVAGVVTAVEAASAAFAYSMRRIYFQSELAGSSVKNLKSLEYAGKQIGITGDAMGSAIHGMAQAMRLNPGLQGLIESFGIKVTGRDVSDVMLDFVKATKDMPEFVGAQYVAMFGIDPDTYHQMITHMDELTKKRQEMLNMYKQSGVDPDAAKKTMLEYTQAMDLLEAKLSVLGQGVLIKLAPAFRELNKTLIESIDWWTGLLSGVNSFDDAIEGAKMAVSDFWDKLTGKDRSKKPIHQSQSGKIRRAGQPAAAMTANDAIAALQRYGWTKEQATGIVANLNRESQLNPGAVGDKGSAYGIAQWHPDRQAEFAKWAGHSIQGSTAEEQLRFLDYELRKGKETRAGKAISGARTAKEAGEATSRFYERPADTEGEAALRGAAAARLGGNAPTAVALNQTTTINVTGSDAGTTAKKVAGEQQRVNGDLVRNMKGAVI